MVRKCFSEPFRRILSGVSNWPNRAETQAYKKLLKISSASISRAKRTLTFTKEGLSKWNKITLSNDGYGEIV